MQGVTNMNVADAGSERESQEVRKDTVGNPPSNSIYLFYQSFQLGYGLWISNREKNYAKDARRNRLCAKDGL